MPDNTMRVRLAQTHSIYKEEGVGPDNKPYDIHITGFDPVTGQVVYDENNQPVTPAYEVPRTAGVADAVYREHRLLEVRGDDEWDRLRASGKAEDHGSLLLDHRDDWKASNPPPAPTETVTVNRAEYDAMVKALAGKTGSKAAAVKAATEE